MSIPIGISKAHIEIKLNDRGHCIRIVLYIPDDKALYHSLENLKKDIENDAGHTLEWRNFDRLKKSEIIYKIPGLDFDDDSNYDSLMRDTLDNVVRLRDIYIKYLKRTGNM